MITVEWDVSNCFSCPHFSMRALPEASEWDYLCKDREILGEFLPGSTIDKDCPYRKAGDFDD